MYPSNKDKLDILQNYIQWHLDEAEVHIRSARGLVKQALEIQTMIDERVELMKKAAEAGED